MARGQYNRGVRKNAAQEFIAEANSVPLSTGDIKQKGYVRTSVKEESDYDKVWHFQLCRDFPENWFPTDKKTGKIVRAPYPKHFVIPNEGIAFDADYVDENGRKSPRARKWRYIEGQPSIWADEQPLLEGMPENEIQKLLAENQIEFEYGQLHVRGIETLKLAALKVQDLFEGKQRQYQPKLREYRLLNPEEQVEKDMSLMNNRYLAEKAARECTTDQMIENAFVMGIDTSDLSDAGIKRIRYEFIKKAQYDPQNPKGLEWFMGIVNSPSTHVHYVFALAMSEGLLSATQQHNKLTWAASNSPIMEIISNGNVVDQLVTKWEKSDKLTVELLNEAERQLFETVETPEML